jgi:hypothetical protein
MARASKTNDPMTLRMALVGYQYEKEKIEAKIAEIQAQLKGKKAAAPGVETIQLRKRILSEAARNRIADAQRKRWAEHHQRTAEAAKAAEAGA